MEGYPGFKSAKNMRIDSEEDISYETELGEIEEQGKEKGKWWFFYTLFKLKSTYLYKTVESNMKLACDFESWK